LNLTYHLQIWLSWGTTVKAGTVNQYSS